MLQKAEVVELYLEAQEYRIKTSTMDSMNPRI